MEEKLKISRLMLENIRGFESLDLEFGKKSGANHWSLFLGDNGSGKTTILKSIALALGDRGHAAGLLPDFDGNLVRRNARKKKGRISLEFVPFNTEYTRLKVDIEIIKHGSGEEIFSYSSTPKNFPWHRLFACGYGAGRGVEGTESWSKYRVVDAVYSLFQYSQPLQNGELALLRIDEGIGSRRAILNVIENIMMLEPGSITLSQTGVSLDGPWGKDLMLKQLGDGYRATFSWIADLMGWVMLMEKGVMKPADISGIVLIDELDQHLHPIWQRRLVNRLHRHFPNIQFIATTHSPIIALGTTDLDEGISEIFAMNFNEDKGAAVLEVATPRGKRVDQILTSPMFGFHAISDDDTAAQIRELANFGLKKRTRAENDKREKLISSVRKKLKSEPTEIEEMAKLILNKVLEEDAKSLLQHEKEILELELRRRLDKLINENPER